MTNQPSLIRRHPGMLSLFLLVVLWYLASSRHWVGKTLLASPAEVARVLVKAAEPNLTTKSDQVYIHAFHTIRRAVEGWALAVGLGICLGVVTGSVLVVYLGSEFMVEFARAIPPVMAFPLFLVAFDYGEPAYTWTIVFGCLPAMILAVARGVQGISREKLELLVAYRVAPSLRWFATGMEILPSIFLGARLTLTMALVIAVVTEMVFAPRSGWALGALARDSEIDFDTPRFYACAVIIGVFGFAANLVLRRVEERLDLRPSLERVVSH